MTAHLGDVVAIYATGLNAPTGPRIVGYIVEIPDRHDISATLAESVEYVSSLHSDHLKNVMSEEEREGASSGLALVVNPFDDLEDEIPA